MSPAFDGAAIRKAFRAFYGRDADVVAAAPGCVNLIGEHTDYNDRGGIRGLYGDSGQAEIHRTSRRRSRKGVPGNNSSRTTDVSLSTLRGSRIPHRVVLIHFGDSPVKESLDPDGGIRQGTEIRSATGKWRNTS